MRTMRVFAFTVGFIFLSNCQFVLGDESFPTAQELVKKMIEYRQGLKNGKIILAVEHKGEFFEGRAMDSKHQLVGYFMHGCIRNDRIMVDGNGKELIEQTVVTPAWRIHIPSCEDELAFFIGLGSDTEPDYRNLVYPDLLGLYGVPISFTNDIAPYDVSNLCPANVSSFNVEKDILEGIPVWKISFSLPSRNHLCNFWVDPERGHNLVRLFSRFTGSRGSNATFEYNVKLKKFGNKWFPSTIRCIQREDSVIVIDEHIEVKAEFGNVTDKMFTLAGLDIPLGRKFFGENDKGMTAVCYWDGNSISQDFTNADFLQLNTSRRNGVIFVNALLLALIALHFFRKFLSRNSVR